MSSDSTVADRSPYTRGEGFPQLSEELPRRFALGDAMIMIALMAVLSAWFTRFPALPRIVAYARLLPVVVNHVYFQGPAPVEFPYSNALQMKEYLWGTLPEMFQEVMLPLLLFSSPAVFLMRLRKPRPAWARLFRQPGALACLSVVAMTLMKLALYRFGLDLPTPFLVNCGVVVAGSWAILLLARGWRTERAWLDRLGRVVGIGWIVASLSEVAVMIRVW